MVVRYKNNNKLVGAVYLKKHQTYVGVTVLDDVIKIINVQAGTVMNERKQFN